MKKALVNTRVSVKLRKSEYRDEWYLYVESYPVFQSGKDTPQRVREYLNRTITTPVWDKSRNARTNTEGKTTYKPKRDLNGIIQCKSQLDQESCIYADKVRSLRQKEYDNAALYADTDAEQAEQLERSRSNFIEYFDHVQRTRHAHSSDSIIVNWRRVHELLKIFAKSDTILFSQIDLKMVESFRQFIMNAPQGGTKRGTISQNTAATYFSIFKAGLKQAFIDGYLTIDISAKVKGIQERESRREYLTVEELNRLAQTPCDPLLKRAALFSALTGIRHCDIQKLKWSEVENFNSQLSAARAKAGEYQKRIKEQNAQIKRLQEEAARAAAAAKTASRNGSQSASSSGSSSGKGGSSSSTGSSGGNTPTVSGGGSGGAIASYGLQFVGHPYVSGGNSLTNGTDCSGFVHLVHAHFGISTPRQSGAIAGGGKAVNVSDIQPGDVIYYGNHVGIYIGNGQIVHASTAKTGIKVSSYTYRTILAVRRYW